MVRKRVITLDFENATQVKSVARVVHGTMEGGRMRGYRCSLSWRRWWCGYKEDGKKREGSMRGRGVSQW